MIDTNQTEIETVERHIREAEDQVARQREIVDRLPPSGEVAEMARSLLAQYEEALSLHRAHLARLRGAA
jgi:hypothetical protein